MKKLLLWGIPLVALGGLVAWRFMQKGASASDVQQQAGARRGMSPSVEVAEATSRVIVQGIESVGTVESPYRIEISPKTSGRIEFLQAREGDTVKPGQVLVRIDPSELEGQVLQQQAAVAQAKSRLAEAQLGRGPTEVGITSGIQQQRAAVASAKADLNQVEKNYDAQIGSVQADVTDAEGRLRSAQAAVRNAESGLAQEQASLKNEQARLNRVENLYRQGFIAAQEVDDARTAVELQRSAVEVARGQVSSAGSAVSSAQAQLSSAKNKASIAQRQAQAAIQSARARVSQAQAGLNVASANRVQNPAFNQNIAALRSAVQAAEAQLSQARSRLNETVLRSSIVGTVTARGADPGALASPGTPVLVVQFLDWLYVTSSLPIDQAGNVTVGQAAEVRFDALPGRTFYGKVVNVNPSADIQSRQFTYRVRLDNPRRALKPGMYGKVALVQSRTEANVVVPREAVKTADGKSTVTVVDDESVAHVREVKLGATDAKGVQIVSGVKKGEKVIVLSYQAVKDEQKVKLPGAEPERGGGGTGGGAGGGRPGGGGRG